MTNKLDYTDIDLDTVQDIMILHDATMPSYRSPLTVLIQHIIDDAYLKNGRSAISPNTPSLSKLYKVRASLQRALDNYQLQIEALEESRNTLAR